MEQYTCSNCGYVFADKYCNHCGQKHYTEKDKTVKHFLEETVHFFTHFDGSFFTTLKTVLLKPGKLSQDYATGRRKPYYKPISFFLLVVVIYLLFPIFAGLNMAMSNYVSIPYTGNIIRTQIEHKLKHSDVSEEALSERFHKVSVKTSKILLLLMIPLTTLAIFLLYFYYRRPLFDYLILSTEINIFFILFFFVLFPLITMLFMLIIGQKNIDDEILGPVIISLFLIFNWVLLRRFFREHYIITFLKALAFTSIFMWGIMPLYRFIIFEVTFAFI